MNGFTFSAELTDFKMIYNILKATCFKEYGIIHLMEEGLKVTVDEVKSIESSIYIPLNLFSSYYVDPNVDVKFKINLKVLTECLCIYGEDGGASLKMSYKNIGSPLCLIIKHSEENILVDCSIQTMDASEFTDLSLADECTANKIIICASNLYDVLTDFDQTSDEFRLFLSAKAPYFQMSVTGVMGETVIDIPKYSDVITMFQCDNEIKSSYTFHHIRQIFKAMSFADKVSISTSKTGLLGMQLSIKVNDKHMYVEYYVMPLFF